MSPGLWWERARQHFNCRSLHGAGGSDGISESHSSGYPHGRCQRRRQCGHYFTARFSSELQRQRDQLRRNWKRNTASRWGHDGGIGDSGLALGYVPCLGCRKVHPGDWRRNRRYSRVRRRYGRAVRNPTRSFGEFHEERCRAPDHRDGAQVRVALLRLPFRRWLPRKKWFSRPPPRPRFLPRRLLMAARLLNP